MEDYRDQLQLEPELLEALEGPAPLGADPAVELRQCLFLNVAGALLGSQPGPRPGRSDVQRLAHRLRAQAHLMAFAAQAAIGESPPQLTHAEAGLRVFWHDCL